MKTKGILLSKIQSLKKPQLKFYGGGKKTRYYSYETLKRRYEAGMIDSTRR